jgi:hypothetical protein
VKMLRSRPHFIQCKNTKLMPIHVYVNYIFRKFATNLFSKDP